MTAEQSAILYAMKDNGKKMTALDISKQSRVAVCKQTINELIRLRWIETDFQYKDMYIITENGRKSLEQIRL